MLGWPHLWPSIVSDMQTNFRRTVPQMEVSTKLAESFTRNFQIIILSSNGRVMSKSKIAANDVITNLENREFNYFEIVTYVYTQTCSAALVQMT